MGVEPTRLSAGDFESPMSAIPSQRQNGVKGCSCSFFPVARYLPYNFPKDFGFQEPSIHYRVEYKNNIKNNPQELKKESGLSLVSKHTKVLTTPMKRFR